MSNLAPEAVGNTPINRASDVIQRIMSILNVKRIVYIDDLFDLNIEKFIEIISVGLSTGWEEQLKVILPTLNLNFEDDDVWRELAQDMWKTLNRESKYTLMAQLYSLRILPDIDFEDVPASDAISSLIPSDIIEYRKVSPLQWDENRVNWLSDASANNKILCLFDLAFKYFRDGSQLALDGLSMMEEAYLQVGANEDSYDGRVVFGFFSHTIKLNEEKEKGFELCNSRGISEDLVLSISKKRYPDPVLLAEGLQMMLLNIYAGKQKKLFTSVMKMAFEDVIIKFNGLHVFDFDDIIMKSSLNEGVWEGETMLRLFVMLQQQYGNQKLTSDNVSAKLNEQIRISRELSIPRLIKEHESPVPFELRHLELYEDGKILNSIHSPLRLGDIFQFNNKEKYILLSPACDLMVRSSTSSILGMRGTLKSELQFVELFRISSISLKDFKELPHQNANVLGFLKSYSLNKVGRVSFKEKILLPIKVLDLSVLSNEGLCQLDFKNLPVIPAQFHPAWQERYNILINYFTEWIQPLTNINLMLKRTKLSSSIATLEAAKYSQLSLNLGPDFPGKPTYNNNILDFDIKRTSHYRFSVAQHLMTKYSQFLSRPAEDHDFSFIPKVTT